VQRVDIATTIEATHLGGGVTQDQVRELCGVAVRLGVRAVCVPLDHVSAAAGELAGRGVLVVTVAGFPGGDPPTERKVAEVERAARDGADEVDVVIDHRRFAVGDVDGARRDLTTVTDRAHGLGMGVKAILETGALETGAPGGDRIAGACELALAAGADWVKTSTGFGPRGATVDDVHRMRAVVGDRARVKAAGGIRTRADALVLLDAGADALGTSSFQEILGED
jgi:deoxyribose-phosphate aldolase